MSPRPAPDAVRGMLKARDPFELIRWLAYSQSDPRKALAELVQNSLDAGARTVRLTRFREDGRPALRIFDDGQGVIPELDRREALQYVATHIGHSRKRHLSPQERLSLMTQGQYGIGLLGFWSLGERLEMRSAVPGHRPHRLVLGRDRPGYLVEPLREHLPLDDCWTEVLVLDLDDAAFAATAGAKAADYLAAELRGQLLARPVELTIEDRLGRGSKLLPVRPAPLLGRPIAGIAEVEVDGFGVAALDVGLWDGPPEASPGIALYAAGTRVAERLAALAVLALDRAPWTDPRLTGSIDYAGFRVPPGSREGVLPDDAALAFARALRRIEPAIERALDEHDRAEAERAERGMLRELRSAFEGIARRRPELALRPAARAAPEGETPLAPPRRGAPPSLLPPGPAVEIVVAPEALVLSFGERAVLRAGARDALGHAVEEPLTYRFTTHGAFATVLARDGDPEVAELTAGSETGRGTLRVAARCGDREIETSVPFEIVRGLDPCVPGWRVPEPVTVDEPEGAWRSRTRDERWEVNAAHPDWLAADGAAAKVRYLALLLAKEIALRTARPEAPLDEVLERAAAIGAEAERALSRPRRRG